MQCSSEVCDEFGVAGHWLGDDDAGLADLGTLGGVDARVTPSTLSSEPDCEGSDLGSAVKGFRKSMSDDSEAEQPSDGTEPNKTTDTAAKDK